MSDETEHPLKGLVTGWCGKLKLAREHKKKKFQELADEAMQFYNGPHTFMWDQSYMRAKGIVTADDDGGGVAAPTFRFTMNKVAEIVQLFGPALYHQNPVRTVTTRPLPQIDPMVLFGDQLSQVSMLPPEQGFMVQQQVMMQQQQLAMQEQQENLVRGTRATLLDNYLNYTPNELNLKQHSRRVIDEALIKGMGTWWTELYAPPSSQITLVGSFYDTVDSVFIDPDSETLEDAQWVARRCTHPWWEVEREYELEPGSLKKFVAKDGHESAFSQGESTANDWEDDARRKGETNDLITYYKIYSKMGMGGRMSGIDPDMRNRFEDLGDYCFLVAAEGVPFLLNVPDQLLSEEALPATDEEAIAWQEDITSRVQWPIPFWLDGEWPFTELSFHEVPNCAWPMSHVMPGLGELRWLNWAMSFLAQKVRTSCGTYVAVMKAAGEELKKAIITGGDNVVLELENALGKQISDVVSFLQQPPFQGDIYKVIQAVAESFEKRVGLTELAYGLSGVQIRSAKEAEVKQGNFSIRPDDMANKVEDAMTRLARKEALAARWMLSAEDVAPILGPLGSQLWAQLVQSADVDQVVRELDYRVEAGSARKPNKSGKIEQMGQALQNFGPVLQQFATMGQVGPLNALLEDWAKANDIDPTRYMIQPPMPMAPPPQEGTEQDAGPQAVAA